MSNYCNYNRCCYNPCYGYMNYNCYGNYGGAGYYGYYNNWNWLPLLLFFL